jgi:hypothetical protein
MARCRRTGKEYREIAARERGFRHEVTDTESIDEVYVAHLRQTVAPVQPPPKARIVRRAPRPTGETR